MLKHLILKSDLNQKSNIEKQMMMDNCIISFSRNWGIYSLNFRVQSRRRLILFLNQVLDARYLHAWPVKALCQGCISVGSLSETIYLRHITLSYFPININSLESLEECTFRVPQLFTRIYVTKKSPLQSASYWTFPTCAWQKASQEL